MRWVRYAALTLVGILILLLVAGACYQAITARADVRRFPEPGRLVDIGGYRLKLNCTGFGSPTVVLESGFGDVSIEWQGVQAEISKSSRVCSYDRAGYGDSDAGTDAPYQFANCTGTPYASAQCRGTATISLSRTLLRRV